MPRGLGPRAAVLAAALMAVAIVAVLVRFSTWTIVVVMTLAFLVASAIEILARRGDAAPRIANPSTNEIHRVAEPADRRAADELLPAAPEPEREPPPEPERPPLFAARRRPASEPEPVIVTAPVVRHSAPREWNLWELEQASRKASGDDPLRDEERNYLLVYLREFANAEGTLPADFDSLVRDSFADVIAAR